MRQDAATLQTFYQSSLGQHVAAQLKRRLQALWPDMARVAVLGHGYVTPLFDALPPTTKARLASMPGAQGATRWASGQTGVSTVLSEEDNLPFMTGLFDRVIILHGLEETANVDRLIEEAWRVLVPEGRIVVIASNRLGLWSRSDRTPFGHGRPWTRLQVSRLLTKANFRISAWSHALHTPPVRSDLILKFSNTIDKAGEALTPNLAGVVMVEAIKRLYIEPTLKKAKKLQAVPVPAHNTASKTIK